MLSCYGFVTCSMSRALCQNGLMLSRFHSFLVSDRGRETILGVLTFLLFAGQGVRYMVGLVAYGVIMTLVVLVGAVSLFRNLELHVPGLLVAFMVVAGLTSLWSATPYLTVGASFILVLTTVMAFMAVRTMGPMSAARGVYWGLGATIVVGLVFELGVSLFVHGPFYPLSGDLAALSNSAKDAMPVAWSDGNLLSGGPIKGFVGNRNPFAASAMFLLLFSIVLGVKKSVNRSWIAFGVLSVLSLLLTRSATITLSLAFIAVLALCAFVFRCTPTRLRVVVSRVLIGIVATASILAVKWRDDIFGLLDRSDDFTNRASIWEKVVHMAWNRPEGWGWVGSNWPVWDYPYTDVVSFGGHPVTHAHNALLDVWLQTGLVGLILFMVLLLMVVGDTWRKVERRLPGTPLLPVLWMLVAAGLILNSMTESRLLMEGHWFLLMMVIAATPRALGIGEVVGTKMEPSDIHNSERKQS